MRKRNEETASQAISQQLASIVELSDDAIISKDLNGIITSWNRGAERLFGYVTEEVIGKPVTILIPQDRHDEEPVILERIRRGDRVDHYETVRRRKDGSLLDVSLTVSPVRDTEGRVVGASKIARDITLRKRAEEQIRQAQERLDLALKGGDLATWDWNIKTDEVIFNPRWAEMRGFRPEEIGPHADSAFADIHRDDWPAVQKALDDCLEGLVPECEMTFRISAKNGDWIWLLARGKGFGRDERGRSTRMVGTAFDITARKRAEEARDDILGVVAHDLRNPLAAIVSLAEVLCAKGAERQVGEEILVAATRMNRLIGDLLDVTRMEAGHHSLKQERLSAAEVIADALAGQTPLAASAALQLRLEAAPVLPDIWADRDRLLQVFENLLGNAIKFTKPGGRITLGATARKGDVIFSVSDTGRGIASTHLPHVFDRFWQAPGTERRGMGFGLAIVKNLVEAHGGRVWAQSSPGQGSTFFFTIPTSAAQTGSERRRSVNNACGGMADIGDESP